MIDSGISIRPAPIIYNTQALQLQYTVYEQGSNNIVVCVCVCVEEEEEKEERNIPVQAVTGPTALANAPSERNIPITFPFSSPSPIEQ